MYKRCTHGWPRERCACSILAVRPLVHCILGDPGQVFYERTKVVGTFLSLLPLRLLGCVVGLIWIWNNFDYEFNSQVSFLEVLLRHADSCSLIRLLRHLRARHWCNLPHRNNWSVYAHGYDRSEKNIFSTYPNQTNGGVEDSKISSSESVYDHMLFLVDVFSSENSFLWGIAWYLFIRLQYRFEFFSDWKPVNGFTNRLVLLPILWSLEWRILSRHHFRLLAVAGLS